MSKFENIRDLLNKFYNGETSLSEEDKLTAFFEKEELPEDLLEEKNVFLSFRDASSSIEIPDDLDHKILSNLMDVKEKESRGKRITLFSLSGLAAGLLIMLSVYMGFLRNNSNKQLAKYEIEDPEIAYKEIVNTLNYVSDKWNRGAGELNTLNNINKGMKSIQPINKISSGSRELNLLGKLRSAESVRIQ
ncbi:MAG TPA: hypothetical protein VJ951_07855 [Bacteroidales bacterium]|nr:hypothetical protein [Bacteroidales bacterium]